MPDGAPPFDKFEQLRQQAEEMLRHRPEEGAYSTTEFFELIHELKIQQAELEIQNEELQQAQQEIFKLKQEYENLYEFAPCGYITLDANGLITRINLSAVNLLGVYRNSLLNSSFFRFICSGWDQLYLESRREAIQTGEKQSIELPLKGEGQDPLWVRAEIEANGSEATEEKGWRMVLVDISKQKAAEQGRQASEERFRSMMESMKDAAYIVSPDYRVEYMNPQMISLIGRDATGELCYQAMYGNERKCAGCVLDQILKGESVEYEYADTRSNRHYSVLASPIHQPDGAISKLTVFRDITENKAKEAMLRQVRKMESIGTLAGGIAHDFNNILYIIWGNTELALDEIPADHPAHGSIKAIQTAGQRGADIVNQLLHFSRGSEQGSKAVDVVLLTKEVFKLLRATIPATIDIRCALSTEALTIRADPVQFHQVLMNLCINASQAMEESGGSLEIRIDAMDLDAHTARFYPDLKPGPHVRISVCDTGPGIAPEHMDRIFDPYFTTKEVGKGSGMGLAVVHGIVKSHNGTVTARSRPGKGATFSLLFPRIEQAPAPACQTESRTPQGNETILFVDDEPSIREMIQMLLNHLGYRLEIASDPTEALALFNQRPQDFDLVITDMSMPRMSGVQLFESLKAIREDIPVILCTGHSCQIDAEKAAAMGIDAYLMKPTTKQEIAETIRQVLDKTKQ